MGSTSLGIFSVYFGVNPNDLFLSVHGLWGFLPPLWQGVLGTDLERYSLLISSQLGGVVVRLPCLVMEWSLRQE